MLKKMLTMAVIAMLSYSCGGGGSGSKSPAATVQASTGDDGTVEGGDTVGDPAPGPIVTPSQSTVLTGLAQSFETAVDLINFTSREAKMRQAIAIVKMVVGTTEFKKRVLNHTYRGVRTFVDNRGYSNAQIYQIILEGAEKLRPKKNNQMDLEVEQYYANNNVVGYTYPNVSQIWVNTKFFDKYTAAGVARNLFHEWLHKLGFGHSANWNTARDYSVPYAIGDIVGEIGKQFL